MEREREGEAQAESPSTEVPRLDQLLRALPSATGDARTQIAGQINDLLIAMRAPGNEDEEARVVLRGLELGSLTHLVDEKGRECRVEAVETLLACGFPHALAVDPKDLDAFREQEAKGGDPSALLLGMSVLVGVLSWFSLGVATHAWVMSGFVGAALMLIGIVASIVAGKRPAPNRD